MRARVHPTAVVDPKAEIATNAVIGPYCVVGPNVVIGDACRLESHVNVTGCTTIGARTAVAPFCSLGTPPQSVGFRGGPTRLVVGADDHRRAGRTCVAHRQREEQLRGAGREEPREREERQVAHVRLA